VKVAAVLWPGARSVALALLPESVGGDGPQFPQGRITLAAGGFEAISIDDGHAPSVVCDQTRRLEQLGREGDGPTPGAEHLPEDVVGDWERVGSDPIVGHEQPTAKTLLVGVESIARSRLKDLREECEQVMFDELAEGVQALNLGKECRCAHHERLSTHRRYGSNAANSGGNERHPDNPLIPDARHLDAATGAWSDQGNDAVERKMDRLDRFARLKENRLRRQSLRAKMGKQRIPFQRGQRLEDAVPERSVCGAHRVQLDQPR
jgi:hypothetical protein